MKAQKSLSLRKYVFQNFFKAALLPLLFIECALVLLYFSINAYNHRNSSKTLYNESVSHLREIVANQSRILSKEFSSIRELSVLLQNEAENFYAQDELTLSSSIHRGQYEFAPNGVYYRTNKVDGASSLYYSTVATIGEEEKKKARDSEVLDHIFKNIEEVNSSIVAVYMNTHDSMNRYYPFIDEVYNQFLPDMNIPEFNFYYLADREHNPGGGPVWTETYLDPAGQGWMMSCIVPVYNGETLEGVAGIDITVDVLLNSVLDMQLPWEAKAFLVDKTGTIMAMPPAVEKLFGLTELRKHVYEKQVAADTFKPEEFNLLKSSELQIRAIASDLLETDFSVNALPIGDTNYYLAQATVSETGWKLMVVADRDIILQPIAMMDKRARNIGYLAVGCMVVFYFLFFLYLVRNASGIARKIATPVVDIAEKSSHIAEGRYETVLGESHIAELDALSDSYSKMVGEIKHLHESLKEKIDTANLEITERKAVETALMQRERELVEARDMAEAANLSKSRFLANTSHEIRTPMNAIIGFLQLVSKTALTIQQQDYLLKINQSAERLLGVINDILDISKIEAEKMEIENEEFDLSEVMQSLSYTMATKAHEKQLELVFDLPLGLPRKLVGDSMRLGQILLNLISNAVKFTAQGEVVVTAKLVEVSENVALINFMVKDSGIGIDIKEQDLLFQPFHQADASSIRRFGGTGLGLAICKKLTELMGGEIGVISALGEGATFWVQIPFIISHLEEKKDMPIPDSLAGLRILIVDDNRTCLEVMKNLTFQLGFFVDSADSGSLAINKLKEAEERGKPFGLVLIDWQMPESDGIETSRKIQHELGLRTIPKIMLVSKFETGDFEAQLDDVTLDGFMPKPVTQSLLYDKIMSAFGYDGRDPSYSSSRNTRLRRGLDRIRGARILLIEDNDINQQVAQELLESEGFYITVAENGREGVREIMEGATPFDAVLMDIQMPVMDGNSATMEIRKQSRFADLPIIAMTADAMSGVREKALEVGMNDYITKPIVPDVLLKALVKWVPPGKRELPAGYLTLQKAKQEDSATLPKIEGIDVENGVLRIGGNVGRYKQVLRKFFNSQKDAGDRIREAVLVGELEQAKLLAHSLKGASGNLGAAGLAEQAGRVEDLIEEKKLENLDVEMNSLSQLLGEICQAVSPVISGEDDEAVVATSHIDEDKLFSLMENLRELLLDSDTEAQYVLADILRIVKGTRLEVGFKKIAVYVDGYDDERALDELDILATQI